MTDTAAKLKRKPVNLSIRSDVIDAARALDLNASQAAEEGILAAIKARQAERWLRDNRSALDAHNARIEKAGLLLTPDWARED